MTTNELIDKHNELARAAGLPELTEWKKAKAELEARIAAMTRDPLDMDAPAPKARPSISAIVAELLTDAALNYAEVADLVRQRVPDAATSARSVASIALQLRKKGHVIPARKRSAT